MNRVVGAFQYLVTGTPPDQPEPPRQVRFNTVRQEIPAQPVEESVPSNSSRNATTQLSPDDIFIAVMGVTGAGKSTFINHLADHPVVIGHGLESCTSAISMHSATIANQRVFLIDTPGFDDTYRTDTEVLRDLANHLSESYREGIKLTGIVYLHPISSNRMGGAIMKNLRMFKSLCGEEGLGSVVLATTMWSRADFQEAENRENELQTKREFWAEMIRNKSKVFRQDQERVSAEKIIQYLIDRRDEVGTVVLDIQHDMVNRNLSLDQTAAGQEVQAEIERERAKHEQELRLLRDEMETAIRTADQAHQQDLAEAKAELEAKIAKGKEGLKQLRVNRKELEEQMRNQAKEHREELDKLDKKIRVIKPSNDGQKIIRETKYVPVAEVVLCNVM